MLMVTEQVSNSFHVTLLTPETLDAFIRDSPPPDDLCPDPGCQGAQGASPCAQAPETCSSGPRSALQLPGGLTCHGRHRRGSSCTYTRLGQFQLHRNDTPVPICILLVTPA